MNKCIGVLRTAAIVYAAWAGAVLAAQITFPRDPQSTAECDAALERVAQLAEREHMLGGQALDQRNAVDRQMSSACGRMVGSPNNGYWRCKEPYEEQHKRLNDLAGEHFRERDAITNAGRGPAAACRQQARANEMQRARGEEARRNNERQQREAVARQQEAQRQQQAEQQRQLAEQQRAQLEQQRLIAEQQRMQAEQAQRQAIQQRQIVEQQRTQQAQRIEAQQQLATQLSAMQREAERAQARQPRVIAEIPASGFAPESHRVQTPEMRAQSVTDAAQEQERQKRAEGQALRDVLTPQGRRDMAEQVNTQIESMSKGYSAVEKARSNPNDAEFDKSMKDGMRAADEASAARRRMLDLGLNPNQIESKPIDQLVQRAQEVNERSNTARFISPGVTQVQNDALSGVGSLGKSTSGTLGEVVKSLEGLNATSPLPGTSPAVRVNPAPTVSLDALGESSAVARPAAQACAPLEILADAKLGKAGERRTQLGNGKTYECKDGKWEPIK